MSKRSASVNLAYQGAPGAFSQLAGQLFAKQLTNMEAINYVPCETFAQVFQLVSEKSVRYGIVPLENSSIGTISANYDLLWSSDAFVVAEIILPVHHCLMGIPGAQIANLKEIYSHPAALEQCRKLFTQLPNAKPIFYFDTGGAAQYVQKSGNAQMAAIAGEAAAAEYGLAVLAKNVEDHSGNCTRFGVVTANSNLRHSNLPLPYKISFAVEIAHKPGSLAKLSASLAPAHVNITKVESRPIPESAWHYRFFIDIEVAAGSKENAILQALKNGSRSFKILGRYRSWIESRHEPGR